ncbi:spermidine synthase [Fonticula alba]|uniref:Spermidine synthase n=1 Tax=Fonticula alba TaxID=691883 RepID=A0A058ZA01_FONAL|nr:spermidine synthase [Fonticula alba]KCV70362.1 spermidine synthase [Fonticula alba]|eukprot:XP_009494878.1 spermidine synthase [Fonticula alba]
MDSIHKGWFSERGELWPGQALSLEIEEVLHDVKSKYQHITIYQTKTWGRMMTIDGNIQVTERDEFSYQEMMAHVPMFLHPSPKRVLVIGGGDGGVLREIVKHPEVEQVTICEIDDVVIDTCKRFLPSLACGFDHPKVRVEIGDGFQFLRNHPNSFDVIVTDAPDPIGPGVSLFQRDFFALIHSALREGGVVCQQAESIWLDLPLIRDIVGYCAALFPAVNYGIVQIPTYPCGSIGLLVCSKTPGADVTVAARAPTPEQQALLRYYNHPVHAGAFAIPQFARVAVDEAIAHGRSVGTDGIKVAEEKSS